MPMQLLKRCDVRSNTVAPRAESLTEEEIAWLDEVAKDPIPEPVETSAYILDQVASELVIIDAASTRLANMAKAAETAERAREE